MTFAHVLYRLAHAYPGKVPALASDMAKGEKVMGNKLNPNCTTHDLGAKHELEMLLDFTNGNLDAAEYFAAKANAVVMKLPDLPEMSDMALLDSFMQIMKELGEVSAAFQLAYADGNINKREFECIAAEIEDVFTRLFEFKAGVERVMR